MPTRGKLTRDEWKDTFLRGELDILYDDRRHGKAGRGPKFKPEQITLLQREYRRWKTEHPAALQKEALDHLQGWAKAKFNILAGTRTIRNQVIKPVDDDEMKQLQK